ncbi:MAG TPA: TrbI/VirB10 family protein [Candidatus Acidoferrales bacterium]|nr:TrbI/VirB10 family protein [Candidatus Acidoferrales bacterium]
MNEPIEEKAPKPPGLLPKHVQSWLIVGLALLMVVIMWLTSPKKPQAQAKPNTPVAQPPAVMQVNQTEINELQNHIAELQRQELVAQNALAEQTKVLGNAPSNSQTTQAGEPDGTPSRSEDPIQSEQKKRAYLSLFASNVALSYRKSPVQSDQDAGTAGPNASPSTPTASGNGLDSTLQIAQLLKQLQPPIPTQVPAPPQSSVPPPVATNDSVQRKTEADHDTKEVSKPAATPSGTAGVAAGKTYIAFEGTVLEGVLMNRLDGSFVGPVECLLSDDVYSHDRQHLLIPAGTRILGEAKKVEALGQTRLAVAFHRLIMPDGFSVSLDQFQGLDQIGDTGLRDKVNNHYLRIFGTSLAIGALGAVAETGTGSAFNESGSDLMRQQFASSMAQSSEQILDRFLNILPTVTIREGHRVKVYLSGDLALPDYNNHQLPSNL